MFEFPPEEPFDVPPSVLARLMRGVRIKNARWRLELTQQQLADLANLSRQTIIDVERKGTMSTQTRIKLQQVLGLDLAKSQVPFVEVKATEQGGPGAAPARLFPSAAPEKV